MYMLINCARVSINDDYARVEMVIPFRVDARALMALN